ncbi:hypothetical protein NCCP2716_04090 [Sporosarcina sp. NCCP-2716]|uniref:DUF309 domain-containing protein n=1 Tax=Sporosarcina sp. NCCP-2716 TaxID=2943679 RepID=UPI0020400B54|nr:DUF309 domain-containing protein [Sporosarcina sp. NCCP-2716]GKV67911.1 hypothetical protein NCCP2716_04090 [Sporosarcina sp. NCCP-2716]
MHPYHHPLFVQFLVYFNTNGDYFEGHEVLEDYWKSVSAHTKIHPLTAFILLTTGMYHWRRGNFEGSSRTLHKAQQRFREAIPLFPDYAEEIDLDGLLLDMDNAVRTIRDRQPFKPFAIRGLSPDLAGKTQAAALTLPLLPAGSDPVIHKHMLRDRTDILRLRDEKKKSGR